MVGGDFDPGGGAVPVCDGDWGAESVWVSGVGFERGFGGVALEGEVKQNEVAGWGDGPRCCGAFVVGEVAPAVHDAVFEELRARACNLHVGAVV